MTVKGTGFGTVGYSVTSALSSTAAESTTWHSNTAMLCKAATGTGGSLAAIISAGVVVGTVSEAASYDASAGSVLSAQNMPSSGAASSVSGVALGVRAVSLSAAHGSTACGATVWVAATSVVCQGGRHGGGSLLFKVTVGKRLGTVSEAVTWDQATASATLVRNHLALGQREVTLTGAGLGAVDGSVCVRAASACEASVWIAATSVVCRGAQGGGGSLKATLT
eukprot:3325923-Rhodomonas_salina.1